MRHHKRLGSTNCLTVNNRIIKRHIHVISTIPTTNFKKSKPFEFVPFFFVNYPSKGNQRETESRGEKGRIVLTTSRRKKGKFALALEDRFRDGHQFYSIFSSGIIYKIFIFHRACSTFEIQCSRLEL